MAVAEVAGGQPLLKAINPTLGVVWSPMVASLGTVLVAVEPSRQFVAVGRES